MIIIRFLGIQVCLQRVYIFRLLVFTHSLCFIKTVLEEDFYTGNHNDTFHHRGQLCENSALFLHEELHLNK